MSFEITEFALLSSDGIHTLRGEVYRPRGGELRGVIQLAHGMSDHIGRYKALAEALCENGFALAGHAHLGHGRTAEGAEEFGFFAEKGGADFLVRDMHLVNLKIKDMLPGVPVIVMGHSMGSFISRIYVCDYPEDAAGLIIHGGGGPKRALFLAQALVFAISVFKGKRHRSEFMRSVALKSYNKKFPKEEGKNAWLSRDSAHAQEKLADPYGSFAFTLWGYKDLFALVGRSNSRKWFGTYPKQLPTLIISGDMDAVGDYGRGVRQVYGELLKRGHTALTLKLYEGARHELFGETNREEVFADIAGWLGGIGL